MQRANPLRLFRSDAASPTLLRRELPLEGQVLGIVTIILTVVGQLMIYSASSA